MSASLALALNTAASRWPDANAVTSDSRTFSWSEFHRRCHATAALLRSLGVRRGDRVAVLSLNSHHQLEFYFAPLLLGAIFVPINYRLATAEMQTLVEDAEPVVLMCDAGHVDTARHLHSNCASITTVLFADSGTGPADFIDVDDAIAGQSETISESINEDDPIVLFYTSGTTGRPKGVMLSHRNLHANAVGVIPHYDLRAHEASLLSGPMFHTAGGARAYMSPIVPTHTVIMPRYEPLGFMQLVERHRIGITQFVPTMLAMLLDHPRFGDFDLSSIRRITYGSAPMPVALLKRVIEAFPGVEMMQAFGMTEGSPVITVLSPDDHVTDGPRTRLLESVGRVVDYVDLRITGEDGSELGINEVGELVVRGPNITSGYWRLPEETGAAIVDGWYHTGDAGYIDEDDYVFLAGRIKDMIVSGGENVYPIETENALSEHPAVDECAVIGVPDDHWGEAVHAVVVFKSGEHASDAELIDWCRTRIAGYKCPRSVSVRKTPLPLSPTNKVLKSELRRDFSNTSSR